MAIGTSNNQVFENELDMTLARAAGQDHIKYYTEKYGSQGQEQDMKKAEEISTKVPRREEPVTSTDVTMPPGASAEPAGALKGSAPILPTGQFAPAALGSVVFDPEGSGYDKEGAIKAGLGPDDTGHWPTRDPKTGMVLKGRSHPTIDLSIEEDKRLGYEMSKGEDGRYYSQPKKGEVRSDADERPIAGQQYAMEARKEVIPIGPKGNEAGGGPVPTSNAIHIDKLPITKGPERVTAAALRDGKDVYTGTSHLDVMLKNRNVDLNRVEDGFVTSHGRFVSRQQAMEVVKKSEQALTSRGRSGVMGKRKELMHFDIFPDIVQ